MVIIDLFGKNRLNEEEEKNLNKWRRLTSNQHTYSYNVAAVVSVGAKHNNRIVLNHDRRKKDSTGVNSHSTKSICGLYTHTHSQRNDEINVRFTSTIYTCTTSTGNGICALTLTIWCEIGKHCKIKASTHCWVTATQNIEAFIKPMNYSFNISIAWVMITESCT